MSVHDLKDGLCSRSSLAAYLSAVEAGTLEGSRVNQVKLAKPKVSSTVEKLRGWLDGPGKG